MATSKPGPSLLSLPIELFVNVVTLLPPTQICHFRRVCKSIRAVVDHNETVIARPHLLFHRARLQAAFTYFADPTLDILDSFVRYTVLHGLWSNVEDFIDHYRILPQCQSISQARFDQIGPSLGIGLKGFVESHQHYHGIREWAYYSAGVPSFTTGPHKRRLVSQSSIARLCGHLGGSWPLVSGDGAKVKALILHPDWSSQVRAEGGSSFLPVPRLYENLCDGAAEVLELQETEPWLHARIDYWVGSQGTSVLGTDAADQGELSPLKKAVLMADIVIW